MLSETLERLALPYFSDLHEKAGVRRKPRRVLTEEESELWI
jgi:hypothetical protein